MDGGRGHLSPAALKGASFPVEPFGDSHGHFGAACSPGLHSNGSGSLVVRSAVVSAARDEEVTFEKELNYSTRHF